MRNTLTIISLVVIFALAACTSEPAGKEKFELKNGDLLFQELECGDFCKAIETVTKSYSGARFSHVGLCVVGADARITVLEAVGEGVREIPLDTFVGRSRRVMVGRLNPEWRELIPSAVSEARRHLGKAYDDEFDITNDKFYCSELIYTAFKSANHGQEVFKLEPMTYIDPADGKTFDVWVDYFAKLGKPVPEGKPGLNPGGMSLAPVLYMVHSYY